MQLAVPGAKQKTRQPCRFLYKSRLYIRTVSATMPKALSEAAKQAILHTQTHCFDQQTS